MAQAIQEGRFYKMTVDNYSIYFSTPEEAQKHCNDKYVVKGMFAIVDIEVITKGIWKETEIFWCDASF